MNPHHVNSNATNMTAGKTQILVQNAFVIAVITLTQKLVNVLTAVLKMIIAWNVMTRNALNADLVTKQVQFSMDLYVLLSFKIV